MSETPGLTNAGARLLVDAGGRTLFERAIADSAEHLAPFPGGTFPCLIWDHGMGWSHEERVGLASCLLASGCRYAVCAGVDCEAWHDAVDLAFVRATEAGVAAWDGGFVMTSWHEGESLEDVAFFLVLNTCFDDHDFRQFLVLHIGDGPLRQPVNAAVMAEAIAAGHNRGTT